MHPDDCSRIMIRMRSRGGYLWAMITFLSHYIVRITDMMTRVHQRRMPQQQAKWAIYMIL